MRGGVICGGVAETIEFHANVRSFAGNVDVMVVEWRGFEIVGVPAWIFGTFGGAGSSRPVRASRDQTATSSLPADEGTASRPQRTAKE